MSIQEDHPVAFWVVLVALLIGGALLYTNFGPNYWRERDAVQRLHEVLMRTDSYAANIEVYDRYIDELHETIVPRSYVTTQRMEARSRHFSQTEYNRRMVEAMIGLAQKEERTDLYADLLNLSIELR